MLSTNYLVLVSPVHEDIREVKTICIEEAAVASGMNREMELERSVMPACTKLRKCDGSIATLIDVPSVAKEIIDASKLMRTSNSALIHLTIVLANVQKTRSQLKTEITAGNR